jgi:hypothetical protein
MTDRLTIARCRFAVSRWVCASICAFCTCDIGGGP